MPRVMRRPKNGTTETAARARVASMVARIRAEEIVFGKLLSVDALGPHVAAVRIASGL